RGRRLVRAAAQAGALEGCSVLWVGDLLAEGGKGRELAPTAFAGGLRDVGVDVVGEELKRRVLAVFLAHEEHRHKRRQQRAEGRERPGRRGHSVAERPIADLVMIL